MTIVAVNGGGNTPQGVQLERCFVKSWSTSGDAGGTNDSFNFTDYKPTESVKADDNFSIIDDGRTFDDLAVDPTNPNVDLRPMETPGPDDNVGLPAVQTADTGGGVRSDEGPEEDVAFYYGKMLPAVHDDGLLLPAVQDDSRSSHSGAVNVLLGDGSTRSTDTSAVATLMGFDCPSSDANGVIPSLETEPSLAIEQYWL